jgi:hypothetical protein
LNYRENIGKCINFTENHIKEDISIEEVAGQSGYLLYYFCRAHHRQDTVMDICIPVKKVEH